MLYFELRLPMFIINGYDRKANACSPWTSCCVCVKRITLCNCLCSSSCFSAGLIWNIGEFGAKNYFTDYWTGNTIQWFVPIEMKLFWFILFQNKLQRRVIPYRLLDKYSHLFICTVLKETLNSGQKPVYTFKTKTSEAIAFAAFFYFGQVFVFCRLIKVCWNSFCWSCVNNILWADLQTFLVETFPHLCF